MDNRSHRLHTLQNINQSEFTLENPADDIRGYTVHDVSGEKLGKVDNLIVDVDARKVRFMQIGHGGFLGIGREHSLIPVDAIQQIDDEERSVYINQSRERIGSSPAYQPDLTLEDDDYQKIYDYYGYTPYWYPGYIYPNYGAMRANQKMRSTKDKLD